MEARYYGVSSGNGNDGVSHMFPDYIVKTNEPFRLAELAALTTFKKGKGQEWAKKNMEVGGEADYTIHVTFMESPETQDKREELPEDEQEDYGLDYAWLVFEVFPWEDKLPRKPIFESLEEAFGEDDLKLVAAE